MRPQPIGRLGRGPQPGRAGLNPLAPLDGSRLKSSLCSLQAGPAGKRPGLQFGNRIESLDRRPEPSEALLRGTPELAGRKGFGATDRQFKQLQAEFKRQMNSRAFELASPARSRAGLQPIAAQRLAHTTPLQAGSKPINGRFAVLPEICGKPSNEPSRAGGGIPTLAEVEALLPAEYFELKQMMGLHTELKSQMASNRAKLEQFKGVEDDQTNIMSLLREQAAHVVDMMKDVLSRLECFPEELWALYGTVEAFEGAVADGSNQNAVLELYEQVLTHVQAFLGKHNNKTSAHPGRS